MMSGKLGRPPAISGCDYSNYIFGRLDGNNTPLADLFPVFSRGLEKKCAAGNIPQGGVLFPTVFFWI
jgi:hypothetical protein